MADILQITLPDGTTYNIKDNNALPLTGGQVTGPVTFGDSVSIDDLTAGNIVVTGNISFVQGIPWSTITGTPTTISGYGITDAVTNVSWDSTNWKIQKTINGTTSDVVTLPLIPGTGTDSAVGGKKTTDAACVASGNYSFAFGSGAQATNTCAVAFNTISSGVGSFSVGSKVTGKNNTEASGFGAIAMGASCYASGIYATSIGFNCDAQSNLSICLGSMAEASAVQTISIGSGTKVSSAGQIALGMFNIEDDQSNYLLIVGNGTADNARSNAMTVDWNGNIGANNIVTSTSVSNTGLISFLNSNSTAVYTIQLPLYNGGVS